MNQKYYIEIDSKSCPLIRVSLFSTDIMFSLNKILKSYNVRSESIISIKVGLENYTFQSELNI